MSPDCTSQQVDENCEESTKQCIMVSGSLPSCRCANANNGFRPCNKGTSLDFSEVTIYLVDIIHINRFPHSI
uniref:EGF-like domain-containing protein n=1 Tax=Romanomermis culicivorax TaxID=13658 RepID=A0A915JEN5_ROMCU